MRFRISLCLTAILTSTVAMAHAGENDARAYLRSPLPAEWDVSDSMSAAGLSDRWWQTFDDTLLDTLVAIGERNNYNVAAAAKRIDMARAVVRQSESGYYPQVGVSAGWTRQRQSGRIASGSGQAATTSWFSAGATMNWEIDVFGKVRSRVRESKKSLEVTAAEFNGVMLSLQAEIVTTYFNLLVYRAQLAIAHEHSIKQKHILDITQARFKTGLVSKLDVAQAWQTYYSTIASIPPLESAIHASINSLGILIGEFPAQAAAMLGDGGPLPNWQSTLPAGVPADILRRRPDIVEAEQQLAAAAAAVGVAKKDFLPVLSIEGTIGTSARKIDNLFGSHSLTWSVAPTLSWTLFDGFARKYSLVSAREDMEAAIDSYNLAVMNAVGETDSALSRYGAALRHIDVIQKLCVENEEALQLAIRRYKDSLSPMSDVVNAQLNALAGESDLVQAQASALSSLVTLYEALGGGISPDAF